MEDPFAEEGGIEAFAWWMEEEKPFATLKLLVPGEGLEPSHLAALDPKSSVSTNSTIRALEKLGT